MAGRTLVAHQPTYLPYLGLLHKAARADVFILQDDLRYVKDAVSNRNRVSDGDGWKWLTIPVHKHDGSTYATVTPATPDWASSHRRVLEATYRRAPFVGRLHELYELNEANRTESLATLSIAIITWMTGLFDIRAELRVEGELGLPDFDNPNDRLISLCQRHGCASYLSGVGAHAYVEQDRWDAAGVELAWSDYEPIPYDRGPLPWVPNLSAIDAIAYVEDLPALLR